MKNLIVKKSRNGLGVFAGKNFRSSQNILQIRGQVVHYEKLNEIGGTIQDNSYRFGLNTYLIAPVGAIANYFNHSCLPNIKITKISGKLYLTTFCDITKGQELVFDYSTILAADDVWKMDCNCSQPTCRRVIEKYSKLPKRLQQEYVNLELIPPYIRKF